MCLPYLLCQMAGIDLESRRYRKHAALGGPILVEESAK